MEGAKYAKMLFDRHREGRGTMEQKRARGEAEKAAAQQHKKVDPYKNLKDENDGAEVNPLTEEQKKRVTLDVAVEYL